jgi:hypothetical protein
VRASQVYGLLCWLFSLSFDVRVRGQLHATDECVYVRVRVRTCACTYVRVYVLVRGQLDECH